MNLVLWAVQWALAVFFVFFALIRIVDAISVYRRPSVRSEVPLFTRSESFTIGVVFLADAVGLVSPALPFTALHQRWVVPAASMIALLMVIFLQLRYRYGDEVSWVIGVLLLAIAVLRGWPFAFYL